MQSAQVQKAVTFHTNLYLTGTARAETSLPGRRKQPQSLVTDLGLKPFKTTEWF
jgi:hypothetical protein